MIQPKVAKSQLRSDALKRRDALPQDARDSAAGQIAETVASWRLDGVQVSGYQAIRSELDPSRLLDAAARAGAQLALPVLLDEVTMVFRHWDRDRQLVSVGFGTTGPDMNQPVVQPDLIFMPLAAFTADGQRIGYGKGHFDRALGTMHTACHHPALVGLGFDEQEVSPFEAEDHDVPLDAVLTPSGLRIFSQGRARLAPFLRASERP